MTGTMPVASGLPLVGSALSLLQDPLAFLRAEYARLGPVFRLNAATRSMVVLAGPEGNRFATREGRDAFQSPRLLGTAARPDAVPPHHHRDRRAGSRPAPQGLQARPGQGSSRRSARCRGRDRRREDRRRAGRPRADQPPRERADQPARHRDRGRHPRGAGRRLPRAAALADERAAAAEVADAHAPHAPVQGLGARDRGPGRPARGRDHRPDPGRLVRVDGARPCRASRPVRRGRRPHASPAALLRRGRHGGRHPGLRAAGAAPGRGARCGPTCATRSTRPGATRRSRPPRCCWSCRCSTG